MNTFGLIGLLCLLGLMRRTSPQGILIPIEMDKDIQLPISGLSLDKNSAMHSTVMPIFGRDQNQMNSGQNIPVILDLTSNSILVADNTVGTGGSYGINCQQSNACFSNAATSTTCSYDGVKTEACEDPCKVLMRFNQVLVSGQTMGSYPTLTFSMYTSNPLWETAFGNNGVLGLSPTSAFWTYLNNGFNKQQGQEFIDVSTSYGVSDSTSVLTNSNSLISNSFLTINGRVGINDPIIRNFNNAYSNLWVFEGTTTSFSRNDVRPNANLCVDNTRRSYFMVPDAASVKSALFEKMCGNKTGCAKVNSNMEALDNFKVTLTSSDGKSIDINIKPQEYVNFDSNSNAVIGIEDFTNSECAQAYPLNSSNTNLGVGLLFLTKVEFIVRLTGIDSTTQLPSFQVGFNETTYPNDTIFLTILIALGAIILAIIVGIIFANSCKKKDLEKNHAEEYRREEDN